MDRRFPRAADVLAARPPSSTGETRRVRRRARQPDARVRAVGGHRRPARHHHPPPDHRGPAAGAGRRRELAAADVQAPLVRVHAHAEARRAPAPVRGHRLRHVPRRDRRAPGCASRADQRRAHRRRHRSVLAESGRGGGAGPNRDDLQRRRTAQGPRLPRRGARQGAGRAAGRASGRGRQAARGGSGRGGHRAVRARRRRRVRQGHQRPGARRPRAFGAGRLRALPLRGVLAARRRGHGHRHPARRHHRRRDPRGRGSRRRDLPRRADRRPGRARRVPRPAARRP